MAAELPEVPQFSAEFETALQDCFPSDDPLDAADFDPIAYINSQFPDEESVASEALDEYIGKLNRRVGILGESVTRETRKLSSSTNGAKRGVMTATSAVQDLFTKVKAIKEKATQSEEMVQEICGEIRGLDYAKKNLTTSIRALHNIHMLISTLDQFDIVVRERNYQDSAGFVLAVEDLFTKFEGMEELPKVRSLRARADETTLALKEALLEDFRNVIPKPMTGKDILIRVIRWLYRHLFRGLANTDINI